MDEDERWIYLDGPEPERIRPLLDALRQASPATAEEKARFQRDLLEKLDAQTAAATPQPPPAQVVAGPEPVAEAPAPAGVPRPPERFAGTAPIPPGVRKLSATMPFLAPEQVPADKKAARTVPVPVMKRRGVGETVPVGDDAITRAVAALPFSGTAVGTVVALPKLTLQQYASLCGELSVSPEKAGEILVKYQVGNKAAHGALDAHWGRRFREEAGLRAAFERAFGDYVAWLRTQRR